MIDPSLNSTYNPLLLHVMKITNLLWSVSVMGDLSPPALYFKPLAAWVGGLLIAYTWPDSFLQSSREPLFTTTSESYGGSFIGYTLMSSRWPLRTSSTNHSIWGSYSLPFLNAAKKLLEKIMLRRTKATVEMTVGGSWPQFELPIQLETSKSNTCDTETWRRGLLGQGEQKNNHQIDSVGPTGMRSCVCMWFVTFHLSLRLLIHTVQNVGGSWSQFELTTHYPTRNIKIKYMRYWNLKTWIAWPRRTEEWSPGWFGGSDRHEVLCLHVVCNVSSLTSSFDPYCSQNVVISFSTISNGPI